MRMYRPLVSLTSSRASLRQPRVESGPFGRSVSAGAISRSRPGPGSALTSCWSCRLKCGGQVDVLERRQVAADHGVGQAVGAEEVGDEDRDLVPLVPVVGRVNPVKESTEGRRERAGFRFGRLVRHDARVATARN